MLIKFWGTRGSVARPGPSTARYGGNTSCIEIRSDGGTLIVVDCGTGGHPLGQALLQEYSGPICGHLLISHTHWDHIQGIPFFGPLFVPGNQWDIYGPKGLAQSLRATLAGQMEHTYFPITLEQFAATIRYHDLVEGAFRVGDVNVTARYLNHPALTLGYRFEVDGASLVDHDRQWFKSCIGLGGKETPRDVAFCAHVVQMKEELMVNDTLQDDRFADNPLVLEDPRIRFYAGAPLILEDGSCIGTLCLIDIRPRDLGAAELSTLRDLRDLALDEIKRRPG